MDDVITRFRKKFIQDHNKGEERFLRGLFIEEFEEFIQSEIRKERESVIQWVKENLIPTQRIKLHYFQEQFKELNKGVEENNEELKGWNELRRLQIKALEKYIDSLK